MEGKVWLIVGQKKMGKTYLLRSMLKKIHPENLFLFDPTGQYNDFYKKPYLKFDDFVSTVTRVSGGVIAIEEATINISHSPNRDIKDFCVGSMNKGNTIFLVFHSLRTVPRYIYDLSEMIILFKTNDTEKLVRDKFEDEKFTSLFLEVAGLSMLKGDTRDYSPHKIHEI